MISFMKKMIYEIILLSVLIICILLNLIYKKKLPEKVGVAFGIDGRATGTIKRNIWIYFIYPLTCFITYIIPFFTDKNYFFRRLIVLIFVGSVLGYGIYLFNSGKKMIALSFTLIILTLSIVLLIYIQ